MRRSDGITEFFLVLLAASLGMVSYVGFMRWRYPGGDLSHNFAYVLPIILPFIAFLFDRAHQLRAAPRLELLVDVVVVGTAMMRVFGDVPFVSGHALFLTYAIIRPGSRLTKITAGLVMIQVLYLKFIVWHDLITPVAGLALGVLGGFLVRRISLRTMRVSERRAVATGSN